MRQVDYSTIAGTRWKIWRNDNGTYPQDQAHLAVLMDIREELQNLNRLLGCPNFTRIPATLRTISRNLPARRRRK